MIDRSAQQPLEDKIRSALAVVVGTVREVREPTDPDVRSAATTGIGISEHDPGFAEAVITVTDAIKGVKPGGEIVIRFPTSEDVMWYSFPKLKPGLSGVFILHPDSLAGGAKARVDDAEVPVFTVPHQGDVLPISEAARARDASKRSP
jgi:hypothetical protein